MSDQDRKYLCSKCGLLGFSTKQNWQRHELNCSSLEKKSKITNCKNCKTKFANYRSRLLHEKSCFNIESKTKQTDKQTFKCQHCNATFGSSRALVEHESRENHVVAGTSHSKHAKCRKCGDRFDSFKELYIHRLEKHQQSDDVLQSLQTDPWTNTKTPPPWTDDDDADNSKDIKRTYEQHKHLILKQKKTIGNVKTSYNFPVPDFISVEDMMSHLEDIYENNLNCFKINISIGIFLRHLETGSIRYFVPYHNETIFSIPVYVRNRRDLENIRLRLSRLDISEYVRRQRPNTKWTPILVTNIVYEVYSTLYPLGLPSDLPGYIRKNKNIVSMEKNPSTNRVYTDDKCFFRCLAYHKLKKQKCA